MSAVAILLFGSHARTDQSEDSDTDLLIVTLDAETRHISVGHLSLFLYPWSILENNARNGDLFVCHLVREARPLFDPDGYLPRLKKAFKFRSDYTIEIGHATDFGWYLSRHGDELNSHLQAKRALWCIRTILIARSAERREPVFAPQLLAIQTQSSSGREILARRHCTNDSAQVRHSLRLFLEEEAMSTPFHEQSGRAAFIERFTTTSNVVALKTLQQKDDIQPEYC